MCGIVGYIGDVSKNQKERFFEGISSIKHRGPDHQRIQDIENGFLGHVRLSIIDVTSDSNQPFISEDGKYTLVFNGEIYNYKVIREELEKLGYFFKTKGDTEVLLYAFIQWGEKCLDKLNGFFGFGVYNHQQRELFIARDRFGIKPMFYAQIENGFVFSSELGGIKPLLNDLKIDQTALSAYFQYNYIPAPLSIYKGVKKLLPGEYIKVSDQFKLEKTAYYKPELFDIGKWNGSYDKAKSQIVSLLDQSVEDRLVADVPLGSFLSGGVDSSVVAYLASKKVDDLKTYSIGFPKNPYYDETKYALSVAKKIGSDHQVFGIEEEDLLQDINTHLAYLSEPFADSSAIAVYHLSKKVSKDLKVALSGDGADELFGGYRKHQALLKSSQKNGVNYLLKRSSMLWDYFPKSRASSFSDFVRKIDKYSKGLKQSLDDRYWSWTSFMSKDDVEKLLLDGYLINNETSIKKISSANDILLSDISFVLPNDMLTKVDLMSMANGLEVRTPFLDHRVVEFVNNLPSDFKFSSKYRKKILRDAFQEYLPQEIYHRSKKGFEVPLIHWFKNELNTELDNKVFNKELVEEQGLFNWSFVTELKRKLHSSNPEDVSYTIWALYVFNNWWINQK